MATTNFAIPNGIRTFETACGPTSGVSAAPQFTDGIRRTTIQRLTVWPFCTALGTATFGKIQFYDGTGTGASASSTAVGPAQFIAIGSANASGTTWPAGPVTLDVGFSYAFVSGIVAVWSTGSNCGSAQVSFDWNSL